MKHPDFKFEKRLWKKKYSLVAGLDEVGRGSFAGPVVAAAVVFVAGIDITPGVILINDSKKLTPSQREKADVWIKENTLAWGIGEAPTSAINRIGIAKATKAAFRKAVIEVNKKLPSAVDFLLIDAIFISYVRGLRRKNQLAIIHGDEKSFSIAAASIIAKVYRDNIMKKISKSPKLRVYGWERNKGYGTKEHQSAILKYGLTRYHRKTFVETFFKNFFSSQAQFGT
ncbi:hypothetical protein A3D00_04450 [Candidatus Woesebacteria bacterium RIFCSPHIGHO2_02_FULL_38_9]|uniref:Ribonuclease n=1 Tax=Candidatus Woesebacteria bacterium RIFCSPHIGHO2_01_FULL_39_28 TaxID=1802496 RepID=A0A1F7YGT6_9BACT|nr:MAG: hypothetical protein A2627_05805 [Candidatus Woesebacteria bacterium RIFCSPHIGHO2_01_FULL_39_28]OGM34942.1 MAG: hypothetical protein A3D00_04450 [Candidatus Woesebacteria bacterium RIFCSPHIGHO2_02_FULL_38_9]OGM57455.1 MAG: hypothetical protein A3A50_06000 [Candidatus Woesebacteria bacterium RIFCSPLOWO2_01_FULL_38_20]